MSKIIVFYIIAVEGPKISDTLEMTENHSIRYFLVGSALEYLKISDSLDMTKNYYSSSLLWSIRKGRVGGLEVRGARQEVRGEE